MPVARGGTKLEECQIYATPAFQNYLLVCLLAYKNRKAMKLSEQTATNPPLHLASVLQLVPASISDFTQLVIKRSGGHAFRALISCTPWYSIH